MGSLTSEAFRVAFYIGNLPIYWYAILSIIGYFSAICIFLVVTYKRYKVPFEVAFYYIFFAIPMIILGARIWSYVIGDAKDITQFFNFRTGGLAVQGGVLFGVLTALVYFPLMLRRPKYHVRVYEDGEVYIKQPSMWIYADAIIPTILIGQAIGRWGNFFNGEIYGAAVSASDLYWLKLMMPGVFDHMVLNGVYYQPLFLYESFLNIVTFILIYGLLAEIRELRVGTIASLYFIDYGIIRFITESLRDASFRFTGTYILNSLFMIGGITLFICCQWVFPKYRGQKNYLFAKDYLVWFFHKSTQEKPSYKSSYYSRKESNKIYFANR